MHGTTVKILYYSTYSYRILNAICIKRNPNMGNTCGHISKCEHINHIQTHKERTYM